MTAQMLTIFLFWPVILSKRENTSEDFQWQLTVFGILETDGIINKCTN